MGEGPGLTIESQISKKGSQEVHDVHDRNGDVGHMLHLFLSGTEIRRYTHVMPHTDKHYHTKAHHIRASTVLLYMPI